ncbi:hypothetical protein Scep_025705 [Stephania cephalantha]|uniref:Uncharacterized protein n=1 Tax=Stephania cephalantha TaxID=152367 RepID=A0AAP0EIR2_9MAGN
MATDQCMRTAARGRQGGRRNWRGAKASACDATVEAKPRTTIAAVDEVALLGSDDDDERRRGPLGRRREERLSSSRAGESSSATTAVLGGSGSGGWRDGGAARWRDNAGCGSGIAAGTTRRRYLSIECTLRALVQVCGYLIVARAGRQVSRPEPESAGLLPRLNDLLVGTPCYLASLID